MAQLEAFRDVGEDGAVCGAVTQVQCGHVGFDEQSVAQQPDAAQPHRHVAGPNRSRMIVLLLRRSWLDTLAGQQDARHFSQHCTQGHGGNG